MTNFREGFNIFNIYDFNHINLFDCFKNEHYTIIQSYDHTIFKILLQFRYLVNSILVRLLTTKQGRIIHIRIDIVPLIAIQL